MLLQIMSTGGAGQSEVLLLYQSVWQSNALFSGAVRRLKLNDIKSSFS